ncbi:hypothetical protein B4U80_13757 [Leptotrombidium deliense]|uniref:Chitin-binding type-2 domain-containing protein n=1 Tax=Leptotrombidium deliense TaxID=299467 RepID=A0A443SGB7_9ACAR|nr:hypothetical protein B4U80_13757 [Leptotrombidium deliense]
MFHFSTFLLIFTTIKLGKFMPDKCHLDFNDFVCYEPYKPHPIPKCCSKFIACGPEGAQVATCPENLHFNPVELFCDSPDNVALCVNEVVKTLKAETIINAFNRQ